jgi:ankyrin repeat protein
MKRALLGLMFSVVSMSAAAASQYAGSWEGKYFEGEAFAKSEQNVTLKIVESAPGKFQATLYKHPDRQPSCDAYVGTIQPKTQKLVLSFIGRLAGLHMGLTAPEMSETFTVSVSGNTLMAGGTRTEKSAMNTQLKTPVSFGLTKADDAVLPSRCEVGLPIPKVVPPSEATRGFINAMSTANYDVMEIYLQKGADINCLDCAGNSEVLVPPLVAAAGRVGVWGNFPMVKWLVEHGADINQMDYNGRTALMSAVARNQLAYGYDPGFTGGDHQLVQYLLSAGARLGVRDLYGENAYGQLSPVGSSRGLEYMVEGFKRVLQLLAANGEDINSRNQMGDSFLIKAVRNCADVSVPILMKLGADANVRDASGKTLFDIALERAQTNIEPCNNTLKILKNPAKAYNTTPTTTANNPNATPQGAAAQPTSNIDALKAAGSLLGVLLAP